MNNDKSCQNCTHKINMCGMLLCTWHEAYVPRTGTCPWWVKEVKENVKWNEKL